MLSSKRKVLLKQGLMICILFLALANLVCVLEKPAKASFILDWLSGNTKSFSNNNEDDDDSVSNFDGWQNSPNSDFLKPGTYTLSTDSSKESLNASSLEQSLVDNIEDVENFDKVDPENPEASNNSTESTGGDNNSDKEYGTSNE